MPQQVWGPHAHDHHIVNAFHLMMALTSVKQLRSVHQLSSGYFREELKQRIWGRVCARKALEVPGLLQSQPASGILL